MYHVRLFSTGKKALLKEKPFNKDPSRINGYKFRRFCFPCRRNEFEVAEAFSAIIFHTVA
jgi:hypothetical protein